MTLGEIILETHPIGSALRVVAHHVDSGTEVVFQAPATSSRLSLQKLAASKLKYVLDKKNKVTR
jgi:MinD-like ATPase involved in chromosome partitioning or flagellar assembly